MLSCESEAEPAARSRAMTARMPEGVVHSRTPISLAFSLRLPSTTATGRWRERGRMGRRR
jgi:hypothetical protein